MLVTLCDLGCAGYLTQRLEDAGDIFTATAEVKSVGFKAQMGPWGGLGIYGSGRDAFGVGWIGGQSTGYDFNDVTQPPLLGFLQRFRGFDDDRRRKEFHVVQSWGVPYLRAQTRPGAFSGGFREAGDWRRLAPRYTQIEFAIGLWGGIRFGMNFGELIDFLVGWTTVDIFDDDEPAPPVEWEAPIEAPVSDVDSQLEPESDVDSEPEPESDADSELDEVEHPETLQDVDIDGVDEEASEDSGADRDRVPIDPSTP